jgi:hypothetical protein
MRELKKGFIIRKGTFYGGKVSNESRSEKLRSNERISKERYYPLLRSLSKMGR